MIYTSCYVKLWEIRDAVPDAVFISIAGYPATWFKEFSQLEYKKARAEESLVAGMAWQIRAGS